MSKTDRRHRTQQNGMDKKPLCTHCGARVKNWVHHMTAYHNTPIIEVANMITAYEAQQVENTVDKGTEDNAM